MNRRLIAILFLAGLSVALVLMARFLGEYDPARPRPITKAGKALLVTLKDVKALIPQTHDTEAEVEEFRREPIRGGGMDLVYEFGAKSGDVTLNTVASFSTSPELATARFSDTLKEVDALLDQYGFTASPCDPVGWGDEERCSDVHRQDGAIVGRVYVGRNAARVYQLQLWGVPFANEAAFSAVVKPKLDAFARAPEP